MYLFNKHRNSQQSHCSGNTVIKVNWKTDLRTNPVFGAESTVALDEKGNLYFGSHSGNFYSLRPNGDIRWVFTTKKKIYSSPLLYDDKVFFVGGDGVLYGLNPDYGTVVWKIELSKSLKLNRTKKTLSLFNHLPYTLDSKRKKNITYKSWASPNYYKGKIYATGFGKGMYCYDLHGNLQWEYDLGFPRYQLTGVAIDNSGNIFCPSRKGYLYSFSEHGKVNWKRFIMRNGEPWGNPSICNITGNVFFSYSKQERAGSVFCYSSDGELIWSKKIGAIRGAMAINCNGTEVYCCNLDGYIFKINASNGELILKKQITKCARGLWITPTIDAEENILLATKDSTNTGRVLKMDRNFNIIWSFKTSKVLSVPVILSNGDILFGSWDGYYYSLKTK